MDEVNSKKTTDIPPVSCGIPQTGDRSLVTGTSGLRKNRLQVHMSRFIVLCPVSKHHSWFYLTRESSCSARSSLVTDVFFLALMENSRRKSNETQEGKAALKLDDFEVDFFDEDSDKEGESDNSQKSNNDFISDSVSVTSNSLLRATICELERALQDTRRLLFERDKENSVLRHDLERARKDLHKETQARKKLEAENESKADKSRKEENEKSKLRDEIQELKEKLREYENPTENGDSDEIIPCCSSMHELVELQRKLKETEKQLEEFKLNNQNGGDDKAIATRPNIGNTTRTHKQTQKEIQTQLKMKFLRDAFFYYMIDFHADEQMKAILAILDYEDRRHEIIIESHQMKRQGKKFTVREVSSRSLTFVHEEKL